MSTSISKSSVTPPDSLSEAYLKGSELDRAGAETNQPLWPSSESSQEASG